MPPEKRRPPILSRRHFQDIVRSSRSDARKNNHPPHIPQGRRLLNQLGPGERASIRASRRQRNIRSLHGLGPRVLDELLAEIGAEHGITFDIERKIERYAALDLEAVQLTGGDRFPALPIHVVRP